MKLAHVIMEAEESHNLSSVSWQPRNAGGETQSKGLGSRGADGVNSSPRADEDEMRCSSSSGQAHRKRDKFHLPLLFVIFRP